MKSSQSGAPPLIVAAGYGFPDCVRILVEAGADVNIEEKSKPFFTPLTAGAHNGHHSCLKALIEAGADVNGSFSGERPLLAAAGWGHPVCVNMLLKAGADVNLRSKNCDTALIAAVKSPTFRGIKLTIQCVKILLNAGVVVNTTDTQNALSMFTDFWWQMKHGHIPIKELYMLLYAAGEALDNDTIQYEEEHLPHKALRLNLKSLCREAIRKRLLEVDRHSNLFGRIPRIGLPSVLCRFLLYDQSLDIEDSVNYQSLDSEESVNDQSLDIEDSVNDQALDSED